jgi:hypothetical protein
VQNTFSPPPGYYPPTYSRLQYFTPAPVSKALQIVAPVIPAEHSSEIEALFETFKGKPMHEQKQLLGDRLFPLVKVNLMSILFY